MGFLSLMDSLYINGRSSPCLRPTQPFRVAFVRTWAFLAFFGPFGLFISVSVWMEGWFASDRQSTLDNSAWRPNFGSNWPEFFHFFPTIFDQFWTIFRILRTICHRVLFKYNFWLKSKAKISNDKSKPAILYFRPLLYEMYSGERTVVLWLVNLRHFNLGNLFYRTVVLPAS